MWQRVLERRLVASASCGLKLFKRPCARGVRLGLQLWIRPDRPSAVGDEQRGAVGTRVLDCGFGGGSGRNRGCDVVIAATPTERTGQQAAISTLPCQIGRTDALRDMHPIISWRSGRVTLRKRRESGATERRRALFCSPTCLDSACRAVSFLARQPGSRGSGD